MYETLENRHPVTWQYWLTIDGQEVEAPMIAVVADQGGRRLICDFSTTYLTRGETIVGEGLEIRAQPVQQDLGALLPTSIAEPYPVFTDAATGPADLADGATAQWVRRWHDDANLHGVTLVATRYPSAEHALHTARGDVAAGTSLVVEEFTVPDVAGAGAFRLLPFGWLGLQPPTEGPYIDAVTMVAGDTVLYVSVCCLDAGSDHARITSLAQETARLAAG